MYTIYFLNNAFERLLIQKEIFSRIDVIIVLRSSNSALQCPTIETVASQATTEFNNSVDSRRT